MDSGSTIGMDRFGLYTDEITFEKRVNTVAKLCANGYADRMVLSHDHWCWHDWDFAKKFPGFSGDSINFTHISDEVLPALRERGVSEAQIEQMLVKNPQRIFERQGSY
jgi:phosphotriesterase-related protein